MKRLLCRWFGHDRESTVVELIGGLYPRNWMWCDRCERWMEDLP